ncbi:hypothetical protein Sjap_019911 [Stephania japonica]|uniref:FAD-binding PCMH-type domain-containing protein n=1 Tax=Stephania japonica TaxID=461633 RepID=A0AAP0HYJ6_9MAGN
MANQPPPPHKITTTLFFYTTLSWVLIAWPRTSATHDAESLLSCLHSNGVYNYTTISSDPINHNRLHHLVIQNPMFARPAFNKPTTIVLPMNKEQLAKTITCSARGSWTIRLRSGGHSYEGLSYRAETPFVLIDLMNLNGVNLDLESETAWVESGATLGEIYYKISQASDTLGFSAGYCPTVGSGGHISGGGYGMMSRKYGLASDNVIDALLVDANGKVLDRESMGEDVFWAIRGGGGGSWGAIYAWKIKLLRVPKRVTVFRLLKHDMNINSAANLLNKWQSVGPQLEDHFSLTVLLRADYNGVLVEFHGLYLGPKSEVMSRIDKVFPELEIPDDEYLEVSWIESFLHIAGLESVSQMNDRFLEWDNRGFKTKVDFPKSPLPLKAINGALEMLLREPHGFMVFNGYNGMMSRIRSDESPFPHRNGTLMMIEYLVAWKMEEDWESEKFLSWLREFHDYMGEYINNKPRHSYVNHVDLDLGEIDWRNESMARNAVEISRKWGERYFSSNYDRLVKAKTMIDPNNVFQHPQSIPTLAELIEQCIDDFRSMDH